MSDNKFKKLILEIFDKKLDTSLLFVGCLVRVTDVNYNVKDGSSLLMMYLSTLQTLELERERLVIVKKASYGEYKDIETGKVYSTSGYNKGDVFLYEKALIPFDRLVSEEYRGYKKPKSKVLSKFDELKKMVKI